MTRDSVLLDRLFTLTRGDLDRAEFPFPQLSTRFAFTTVNRIASFWRAQDGGPRISFEQSVVDFVSGLFACQLPWAFLVEAEKERIAVRVGADGTAETEAIRAALRGALPDIGLTSGVTFRDSTLSSFSSAVAIVGCPTAKTDTERGVMSDQIERLCRGLFGARWAYLIEAVPVDAAETTLHFNEVLHEIRAAHETLLLKGSAVDENNRLARQYVELLEAKLKRLQQGRACGRWRVSAFLLAETADVTSRGAALLGAAFAGDASAPDPLRIRPCRRAAPAVKPVDPLTSRELAILVALPREEYPGYGVTDYVRFGVELEDCRATSTVSLGDVLDRGAPTGTKLTVPVDSFTRHGLVAGVTGSGKTNTCMVLLDQVWDRGHGVPFLVIESAKSEYRSLLDQPRFKGLRVFTLGDETVSPFRLNPFEVEPSVLVQTHVDYLKALFAAAFVLYPPMPYVLERSLEEVYRDRGWDLARNVNRRGTGTNRVFPTLTDLHAKVATVIDRMGYDEQITMNVRSGLQARIDQLRLGGGKGLMLDTRSSVPFDDVFSTPCVLELKQVVSDEEKAFLMGLILIRLYERRESAGIPPTPQLTHLTLIEEAHRLLRNTSTDKTSEIAANPRGHAIEVFANILAEIRAFGEGIVLAEQVPAKLAPDAIKNTNLKIVHRLLAEDDRRLMGGTIGLSETQLRYLPNLPPGQAVAFSEGMRSPMLVLVPPATVTVGGTAASDGSVRTRMFAYRQQRVASLLRYPGCVRCASAGADPGCHFVDDFVADAAVRHAFRQLLSALVYANSHLEPALADVRMAMRRFPETPPSFVYCLLVGFLEGEIEARATQYGWTYADVDQVVALLNAAGWALLGNSGQHDVAAVNVTARQDLRRFGEMVRRLSAREQGPFAACASCQERCQYRFDVARFDNECPVRGRDFRAAFDDPRIDAADLARLAWDASEVIMPPGDSVSRRSAAFCFVAHQLAATNLPSYRQERVGHGLFEQLKRQEVRL